MNKYLLQIGKTIEAPSMKESFEKQIPISEDFFEGLKFFAKTRKDDNLNIVYNINGHDFYVSLNTENK